MNNVTLMGRLTRDPETRYSQSAEPIAVTRFSVAVNRKYKKDGEQEADFINCVAFRKTAEIIEKYFTKGKMIGIVGSIQTGSYADKDGNKRNSTEVLVNEVHFCGDNGSTNTQQNSDDTQQNSDDTQQDSDNFYSAETGINDDDLPF